MNYLHYDDFFENALTASNKGKFLKFPRFKDQPQV